MDNFKQACMLSHEEWINSLPTDIEPYNFSKKYNRSINRLFSKMRGDKYHKLTKNSVRIIIIAAILLSLTITALAVPVSRDYIIRRFTSYSAYTIADREDMEMVEGITVGYVPEGFELTKKHISKNAANMEYYNSEGLYIDIDKCPVSSKVAFDTELYHTEKILNKSIEYVLYRAEENIYGVIWNDGKYTYIILGNISKDDILKMAYEIK